MTDEEIQMMADSKDEDEWTSNCDKVKEAHGGYPANWWQKVVQSGLMATTAGAWTKAPRSGAI